MYTISNIELSKTEFFVKIVLYKGYHVDSVVYYRRDYKNEVKKYLTSANTPKS